MTTAKAPSEELEIVCKNLIALKLKHWQSALSTDIEELLPEQRKLVLSHLTKATALELSERHTQTINRRIDLAKFIRIQTIDQFDFDYNAATKEIKSKYVKLHGKICDGHVPRAVFVGNTSLGKTHLARSLGYAACQANISVVFTKAAQIVNEMATAKTTHTLNRELKKYRRQIAAVFLATESLAFRWVTPLDRSRS